MDYGIVIASVLALGVLGAAFALVLAIANARFAVKRDPLEEKVLAALAGTNCGACGYGGCAAYAQAVAAGKVPATACIPGGGPAAKAVANLVGQTIEPREQQVAVVHCNRESAPSIDYSGIGDCRAATAIVGGVYECRFACLGLGTCARVCPSGAIWMSDKGLPVVDEERCTGCGICVKACPKGIVTVERRADEVHVLCRSKDKGAVAREKCEHACIACGLCVKACNAKAIEIQDFLAEIDYNKCVSCGECVAVCPTGAIGDYRKTRRRKVDVA